MPLILPTASTTYGDSALTEGGVFRKYVLAQFRDDASLEWVGALRTNLVREELKYSDFLRARPRLRSDRNLWRRIEAGVGQASIIVIDPEPVATEIRDAAAAEAIDPSVIADPKSLTEACALALIEGTPIAYLPVNLVRAVPWGLHDLANLQEFTPKAIQSTLGAGLRQARVFAARAHAAFDLQSTPSSVATTDASFRSPLARVMLSELLATTRVYDTESPQTIQVLNKAATEIARALASELPAEFAKRAGTLVREVDSRGVDRVQAADIAACWARTMLETGDAITLGSRFERVWVNGRRIK
ncbi:MAG: hypothetical protein LAO30_23620 [Acidobacteriia bacterium]|nr:hypothetical protein [Terriglobia bacterium]